MVLSSGRTNLWSAYIVLHFSFSCVHLPPHPAGHLLCNINTYYGIRLGCCCSGISFLPPHGCTGISKAFIVSVTVMKKTILPLLLFYSSLYKGKKKGRQLHNSEQATTVFLYTYKFTYKHSRNPMVMKNSIEQVPGNWKSMQGWDCYRAQ